MSAQKTCTWREDGYGCINTNCEHAWYFEGWSLVEAMKYGVKFCLYCSKRIKAVPYVEEEANRAG